MRSTATANPLAIIFPVPPVLPDPEPPAIILSFSYQQLKSYRLQSAPYVVRLNYETVQQMLEDAILERQQACYLEWLEWVQANL
ncbi:MAG: hypothetical protein C5B46_05825 [Proteobacteria bacterium]|nr:MAG: hypothetical protein C5B46_05825 [Pseudomonadota bacterium]